MNTLESDSTIGVVGSLLLHYRDSSVLDNYTNDDVQDIGSTVDRFGYPVNYHILHGLPSSGVRVVDNFYISGCSMLFRKNLFNQVGGFDEEYFIYKDDLDLC